MTSVLNLSSVRDTQLWKRLNTGFTKTPNKDMAAVLATKTADLCELASQRIKTFPYFHPQYTLHDQTHLLRVSELMASVIGSDLNALNPIEISLLLLAAHFHDQGMVPDQADWKRIQESADFKLSWQRFEVEHPSIRELRQHIADSRFSEPEQAKLQLKFHEFQDAHRTEYLRQTHGERSEEIVNQLIGSSNQLTVVGANLVSALGRLCVSHVWPDELLTDQNGFRVDQAFGTFAVNLRFLAIILRLADILDFDRDRTPNVLLNTIHLSNSVSLLEWSKHLSVEGWEINSKRIRFSMQCEHPAYQRAAYEFMDAIDRELIQAHRIVQEFPRGTPEHYRLNLPIRVERDRIEPKNDAYRYADLEFSLSRNEVVKLLMTDQLYNSHSLFIRELLQNALDALRYRRAIYGNGSPKWDGGRVVLEHVVNDDGCQVVRCADSGIGMDEEIIRKFLTKAGRSYYRSPEFELQRVAFRENGVDFDPCARFGIGFMSCFMFGDQITIRTRRDYGPERGYGDPIEVEINGLGGLLVIRDGEKDQPVGTTVEIVGPRRPVFLDNWADSVRLCGVVTNYALATEFPIVAKVAIEEIQEEVEIPTTVATRATFLERAGVCQIKVVEQELREMHPQFAGSIRIGLLVDDHGIPTTSNEEAQWEIREKANDRDIMLKAGDNTHQYFGHHEDSTTCLDGILVCGEPGRETKDWRLGNSSNQLHLGDPFLVDIRGEIKPALTPARTPIVRNNGFDRDRSWTRIQSLLNKGHAKAWEHVAQHLRNGLDPTTFWKLTLLHQVPLHEMNGELLWNSVEIPIVSTDGQLNWKSLREIDVLIIAAEGEKNQRRSFFELADGSRVAFSKELGHWYPSGGGEPDWRLRALLLRFAHLRINGSTASLSVVAPESATLPDFDPGLGGRHEHRWSIPYDGDASSFLAASTEIGVVNRRHPIVEFCQSFDDWDYGELDDLQHYCQSLFWALSDHDNLMAIASRQVTSNRQLRRLGCIYRSLDWSHYEAKFQPPYKLWTPQSGTIEVGHDDLLQWAELPVEKE